MMTAGGIAVLALINFGQLVLAAAVLAGSAIGCMWATDKLFRNPFVGLSLWAFVAAAAWAVHQAMPA